MDATSLARACMEAMWQVDATSRANGISIVSVAPGEAVLSMEIAPHMLNWHDTCHGGYIYLFADAAFGYASNTRNHRMVAQYCSISYLNPAKRRERLTARAIERMREGRSGIYDVAVTNAQGLLIAEFRGHARAVAGTILPEKS